MWPQGDNIFAGSRADLEAASAAWATEAETVEPLVGTAWRNDIPKEFCSGNVVYVIEGLFDAPEPIAEAFQQYAGPGKVPRWNGNLGSCLYVGSSRGKIRTRLRQHCLDVAPQTYALRLGAWYGAGLNGRSYRIHLRKFNVNPSALQFIEDAVACQLRPMFGKRGGNGN